MQQPLRPHALRQPAASKLARPVSFHSDGQARLRAPLRTFVRQQDSGVVVAEDPVDRNPIPDPFKDVPGSPSRLPAPRIPRLHGGGGSIGGAKRRSMLPQLSPTKGLTTVLETRKHERGRINEEVPKSYQKTSATLGACNTMGNTKNPPPLGFDVYQNSKSDTVSKDPSNQSGISVSSEDAPRQNTTMKQSGLTADPFATDDTSSRPQSLQPPRALSTTVVPGFNPVSSETKATGSREMIAKSAPSGRARQPTTNLAPALSVNAPRDTASRAGLPIPASASTATARPRSTVLNAGRDFTQENRPASSASTSSTELTMSEKSDAKRQHLTNVGHRRTLSTRSARSAFPARPKELERKDAMPLSGNALASTRKVNTATAEQRPAFSTLQQHFTPKKVLRVPTSFGLAAGTGKQSKGELISPEMARLQMELLQLHVLHKSSAGISLSWQQSAETTLRKRFEDVAQKHRKVTILERKIQAQLNLRALEELAREDGAEQGLGERIQALGSVIPEVVNATSAGGKYVRLVRGFERWIEWIEQIWEARDHDGNALNSRGELEFVEGLGDGWRNETAILSRKLGLWMQDLDGVGSSPAGSSLALVVARCKCLTEGMLQEVEMMRGMEREIVARESRWVSEKVGELPAETGAETGAETVEADSALTKKRRASTSNQGIWRIP